MGCQHLSLMKLLCLLGTFSILPRAEALLCYEARSSIFRAVSLHNWSWYLMRSMVCPLQEGCEETLLLIETGTKKGVVGFKGCTPALSYPPKTAYLVSPPGVSIASYSHVCRSYLCNNLTNLDPIVKLKANDPLSVDLSSHTCPTCVGRHTEECLPNFVTSEPCPVGATVCYSSTVKLKAGVVLKLQTGSLNTTFLLMGCARDSRKLLADFWTIGSIQVTEALNIMEKAQIMSGEPSSRGPACGILLGLLLAFRD